MARYNGLIIPRSYNDYFSRSDPQAIKDLMATVTDEELDDTSAAPIQNRAVARVIPAGTTDANKLVNAAELNEIKAIIPNTASEENELADKNFVNSTVGTNTAFFRGTFGSVDELEAYAGEKTNNDYAFVTGTDSAGNATYKRYKYDGTAWEYEYTLNNSSFTAEQWAAIQSGITAEKVAQYDAGTTPEGIIDLIYPIGFIITTEDKNFDPNAKWPWTTWEIKAKGRVLQGATDGQSGGDEIAAGLPNIKGDVYFNTCSNGIAGTGALKKSKITSMAGGFAGSVNVREMNVPCPTIDASDSSSIYKDDCDTVQPPAIAVYFWKRTA